MNQLPFILPLFSIWAGGPGSKVKQNQLMVHSQGFQGDRIKGQKQNWGVSGCVCPLYYSLSLSLSSFDEPSSITVKH